LGTFHDWSRAIDTAREHAHAAATERIPVVTPGMARPVS
jgi:hypothetical protein